MPKQWIIEAYRPVWADDWSKDALHELEMRWILADVPAARLRKKGYFAGMPPVGLRRAIRMIRSIRDNGPLWENYRIRNLKTGETIPWEALLG